MFWILFVTTCNSSSAHHRFNLSLEESVNEIPVVGDASLVHVTGALGKDPRPGNGESVVCHLENMMTLPSF